MSRPSGHNAGMPDDTAPRMDRRKIRIGLAIITVVLVVSMVMVVLVAAPAGKAVMFAIALTALVRLYLMTRSLRADRQL